MMGTVINKLDGLDKQLSNVESDVVELKSVQKEQSQILKLLDVNTDSITEKVFNHEIRIMKAEQNIENLQGGVH